MAVTGISFILPTYNEAGNIERLIRELDQNVKGIQKEFIVVDDNSTDGTWQIVREMAQKDDRVRLILRKSDPGLTVSLQEGIDSARERLVSWMDCDLSMPPESLPELIREIERGKDCAIGSRYVTGGGILYRAGGSDSITGIVLSMLLQKFIHLFLGNAVLDYTSGFIVVRKKVLDRFRLKGDYGEYFIDLMYRLSRDGFQIGEVPYTCRPRETGASKTGSSIGTYLKKGFPYVTTVLRLKLFS